MFYLFLTLRSSLYLKFTTAIARACESTLVHSHATLASSTFSRPTADWHVYVGLIIVTWHTALHHNPPLPSSSSSSSTSASSSSLTSSRSRSRSRSKRSAWHGMAWPSGVVGWPAGRLVIVWMQPARQDIAPLMRAVAMQRVDGRSSCCCREAQQQQRCSTNKKRSSKPNARAKKRMLQNVLP